jgi:hypothetical protein
VPKTALAAAPCQLFSHPGVTFLPQAKAKIMVVKDVEREDIEFISKASIVHLLVPPSLTLSLLW